MKENLEDAAGKCIKTRKTMRAWITEGTNLERYRTEEKYQVAKNKEVRWKSKEDKIKFIAGLCAQIEEHKHCCETKDIQKIKLITDNTHFQCKIPSSKKQYRRHFVNKGGSKEYRWKDQCEKLMADAPVENKIVSA